MKNEYIEFSQQLLHKRIFAKCNHTKCVLFKEKKLKNMKLKIIVLKET